MLNKATNDALNDQLQYEMASAYQYLAMSAYFEANALAGCAHWMRLQHQEELEHAMKFFDFINKRNGRVLLRPIEQPKTDFASPVDVFENALEHEHKVTERINGLCEQAQELRDFATQEFLQWFVSEQVEEEDTLRQVVDQFKRAGDNPSALLLLDRELASRQAASAGTE